MNSLTEMQARALRRAIRSERMRDLFDRAVGYGWSARLTGDGHLLLSPPGGGQKLKISVTADDSRGGHAALNNEAVLKRWLRQQETQ